jgi:tetratricopeptide (TPR) repeat protein
MESDAYAILEKKQLDALKRLKEANENAKVLLAVEPDASDAYVALGVANYIIGSLNPGYRMALWFVSIHGDKKLGMQQLSKTADNGRYLEPFAKILLALTARREKQNALAQKLLLQLTQEFPSNPTYASEYAKAMGRPIPAEMKSTP